MKTLDCYDVVSNRETRNRNSAQHLWEACEGPVFRIVDEEGNNTYDSRIRHLLGKSWITVDDMDGYQIVHESDVISLNLIAEMMQERSHICE